MKKFMGTPGPWQAEGLSIYEFGCDIHPVAEIEHNESCRPLYESESNVILISAAPDLLEALQDLVNDLANSDDEGLIEHADPMIAARAAIAKALGE